MAQFKVLRGTLEHFGRLTKSLKGSARYQSPEAGSWSVHDVLSNLLSCQDVWTYSIYTMLLEDGASLPNVHPNDWMRMMDFQTLPFESIYSAFRSRRLDLGVL
jgi:hypothetical protein